MRKREVDRLIRRITGYLSTPAGRASLEQARKDAQKFCEDLRKKRAVDPLSLFERVTI